MLGPVAPCAPWITEDDLCCDISALIITPAVEADPEADPPVEAAPAVYDPIVTRSIIAATEFLYDQTCRRWPGVCSALVRPCLPCGCSRDCRCSWTHIALQAPFPIIEILSFEIDGVDQSAHVRLDNNRDLTRLDTATWSCFPRQNMGVADGAVGSWTVGYSFGAEPPAWATIAAGDLTCQLIAACQGGECDLPDGTVSVTKNGVTISLRGPEEGFTNVATADQLIQNYKCGDPPTARMHDPAERPHVYRGTVPPPGP